MTTSADSRSRGRSLRQDALGVGASTAIGIASTAPAYSLAVSVGLLTAYVGAAAPVVLAISAVPVILVALCFRELNRAEPDCGTTFPWTEKAFGLGIGRMVGWTTVMACVLVMSNLAQVAAVYTYALLGLDSAAESRLAQAGLGTAFILAMALLAYRGIRIAAGTQILLLTVELVALCWFAIGAFREAGTASIPLSTDTGEGAWAAAVLVAVFLYWGWDSSFSVNEESRDPRRTPAIAALVANGVLVVLYVVVAWAAVAYAGTDPLGEIADDDFFAILGADLLGTTGGKVLTAAVLVSALASTQTTILPTARTMLSMARRDAFPGQFARISAKYRTPSVSTWVFAAASVLIYVTLVLTSDAVLADSVAAVSILVSLYYLATAIAVPVYFTGELRERVVQRVVVPLLATICFVLVLVLAVSDVGRGPLIVVAVSTAVGAAIMFSMKPPAEGEGRS
ncbi:amino acid/polyamine/organocation transporter (APC superfamily) [Kribbella amoyensis]|uniref:Amino acid/polyamine/organocation transporter (APC superfamily) n=1 Tax=Kribbella amoyensis TaxID=996641 RepID=A0A561BM38_9ACTN|nr:APC family permease [Kribbella amoyensis]TWD79925.1 amino acid/polyamine/organocation transporter (APC superfamily) [Kribbella amoyensis]